ncbi:MAG: ferredoxin [Planctomycetota bacterium]
MRARVDAGLCDASGVCQEVCPEVFVLNGDVAEVKVDDVPKEAEEACRKAALGCPKQAISIRE